MRNLFLTLSPVLLSATLSAQGVFSNRTQVVLEKVIQDYPNHFYNIKGELISQAMQSSRYKSTLQLPGAQSTVITVSSHTQGWSCVVLETKRFKEASDRFAFPEPWVAVATAPATSIWGSEARLPSAQPCRCRKTASSP